MSESKRQMIKALIFIAVASFISIPVYVFGQRYAASAYGSDAVPFSILKLFSDWSLHLLVGGVALVIPFLIRYIALEGPAGGLKSLGLALLNFPTVMLLRAIPYQLLFADFPGNAAPFTAAKLGMIAIYGLWIAAGFAVLVTPNPPIEEEDDFEIPESDSTKCMVLLADFIEMLKKNLGAEYSATYLWKPVYAHLQNQKGIADAIGNRKLAHYEIVLNAVGSMSFKLLAGGQFHISKGVLSTEGEYLREIWLQAAHELLRNNYNTSEDLGRGMMMLDEAISATGK